jgi:type II secretory pathway pseudopilin PulG
MKNKTISLTSPKAQQGVSLLAVLAVVVIGLFLAKGAISMWSRTYDGAKISAAQNQITAIQMSYRTSYSNDSTYGASGTDITSVEKLPTDLKIVSGAAKNDFDGNVTVTANGAQFYQTWANVPDDACTRLSTIKSDWKAVYINGNSVALPVSTATATAACNTGANTIRFDSN